MKTTVSIIIAISVLLIGGIWLSAKNTEKKIGTGEVLSTNGLHWHSQLAIYVKGEKIDIPSDIGLGFTHNPVHTHDPNGEIHLEFSGTVRKDDTKLGVFFDVWKKDIRSFGEDLKMVVNGEENTEYENYHMQDGDTIELYYQ